MSIKDKLGGIRRKSSSRIILIVVLMIIVGIMFYFWKAARLWLLGMFLVLLTALGLEISGNDWDLGKFVQTGSLEQSKIDRTESGTWLIGDECQKEKLNCANFKFKEDAQDLFEKCGGLENDVHSLDGDNDGMVCEHLPSNVYRNVVR